MQLDASTPGAQFLNVSAAADGDYIHLTGFYEASAGIYPAVVFSVGNAPWVVDSCVRNVCCLWEIALALRDSDMIKSLGAPYCDEHLNVSGVNLMKGNVLDTGRWDVRTTIQPSFVAMLFICLQPLYIWHSIIPLQWSPLSVQWNAAWYGEPCFNVEYEGRTVCVHCANRKPANADYVFTANWFKSFNCDWVCRTGYKGPNCEIDVVLAVGLCSGAVGLLAVLILFWCMRKRWTKLCCCWRGKPRTAQPLVCVQDPTVPDNVIVPSRITERSMSPPLAEGVKLRAQSDVITFRDNLSEIRIKFH